VLQEWIIVAQQPVPVVGGDGVDALYDLGGDARRLAGDRRVIGGPG